MGWLSMAKKRQITIALDFGQGSLSEGFAQVNLEMFQGRPVERDALTLPAAPEIADAYGKWKLFYTLFYKGSRNRAAIEFDTGMPTNVSEVDLAELAEVLQTQLENWFSPIDRKLRFWLNPDDEICLSIAADDRQVQKLPWHLLSFFQYYPLAELALSGSKWKQSPHSQTPEGKVRILAVIGSAQGLNVNIDRDLLESLPGVELVLLEEPTRTQLDQFLWDKKGWDIWFFAGHSRTIEQTGRIDINPTESLSIADLKNAVKAAISRGLRIAIFNSCDGLGIAQELEDLHLPYAIAMREPVGDRVAQAFLQYFLQAFAGERQSFYLSVRQAREQLQGLESEFPCASWLPVIWQNQAPTVSPPYWRELMISGPVRWHQPIGVGLAVAVFMIIMRTLGGLAWAEFTAYDRFIRWRTDEGTDPRLLIVRMENEAEYGFPVSDRILADVIETLEQYQPRAIGVDIYRNEQTARPPGHDRLMALFRQNPRLIGSCVQEDEKALTNPPPAQQSGFVNLNYDPDGVLRRISLFHTPRPDDACGNESYLGWQLALPYLIAEGIQPKVLPDNRIQINQQIIKELPAYTGAYRGKGKWGFEILLNYRSGEEPFRSVTFEQVLNGQVDPSWVKDKVIVIGTALPAIDRHLTPYSPQREQMLGVRIVAHTASQVLSAGLDGRPFLWIWPVWGEYLWIAGWSVVGGVSSWRSRRLLICALTAVAGATGLSLICWLLFAFWGGWVPLVPTLFAYGASSAGIFLYRWNR
jgi:CHASE2 domain-containing sensor protein